MEDAFRFADELGPAKIIHVHEPGVGLRGTLVVDNTATGKTLATLLGSALEAGLRNLVLVVQGTISWAAGNATAGVNDLDPGVYSIPCTKAMADTFKFIASANTAVSVIQEG